VIVVALVGGLVVIVAALAWLNRPTPPQRDNHSFTRKPR
jgi:hypothetical protein